MFSCDIYFIIVIILGVSWDVPDVYFDSQQLEPFHAWHKEKCVVKNQVAVAHV